MLNQEEEEFIADRREMYEETQKKDRKERNEYLKEQKEMKLFNMDAKRRDNHINKHKNRRRLMIVEEEIKFQQELNL